MKSYQLSKDSWHYRLASTFDRTIARSNTTDICSYMQAVVYGSVISILISAVLLFFSFVVIHALLGLGFSLAYGVWLVDDAGVAGLFLLAVFLVIAIIYASSRAAEHYRMIGQYEPREPGFVTLAYRRFRDRVCVKITFEKDDNE